jgi:hypothetical protein
MRAAFLILIFGGFFSHFATGQLYLPNQRFYNESVERYSLHHEDLKSFQSSHLSMKPIRDGRTNTDSIYFNGNKYYDWITQKLFKENLIIFKGEDFWCSVDPLLDLEGGTDFHADSLDLLYWNTRGLRVQAKFFDKIAFTTSFYENQALVPTYVQDYVNNYGELRPQTSGYFQEHAVIPGYGRTKPFKVDGYDFAFAEGQVSFVPNEFVNFQFGNGNHFIGNGYRSLLLSDFTTNYPFAKVETNLWQGRIQYSAIYAIHQNLYRLPEYESVESTYERKIGTYHYLDFAITKDMTIGLFEGAQWRRTDSLGTHQPNWLFANPIPFVNGIIMNNATQNYNHIFGLNYNWDFLKNKFYAQVVLDNGSIGGLQLGIKSYEQFVKGLDIQIEYNYSKSKTYLANEKRYNYSHSNLALAHPLTSGFNEGIIFVTYQKDAFFITNKMVYYNQVFSPDGFDGTDILNDQLNISTDISEKRNVLINNLEIGYRFNKTNNLQIAIGWMFREEYQKTFSHNTSYVYGVIRTPLRSKTLDF